MSCGGGVSCVTVRMAAAGWGAAGAGGAHLLRDHLPVPGRRGDHGHLHERPHLGRPPEHGCRQVPPPPPPPRPPRVLPHKQSQLRINAHCCSHLPSMTALRTWTVQAGTGSMTVDASLKPVLGALRAHCLRGRKDDWCPPMCPLTSALHHRLTTTPPAH